MRSLFIGLTVVLGIVGLAIPIAWGAAIITAIMAVASSPPGLRADGKKKSGGLLGGFIDSVVVNAKMTDCPYCGEKIMLNIAKCKHCGEWVKQGGGD